MINTEKYNKVLDAGLLLDHFALLCSIRDNQPLIKNKRVAAFHNLLCKKGYIQDDVITQIGLDLIGEELVGASKAMVIADTKLDKFDYANWVLLLHKKCKDKLIELTGKGQVKDSINGKSYPFLPNSTDLGRVILRAIDAYKLQDFDKIERTLLAYIEKCHKAKCWFPILGYYIMKHNTSTMVTDMETVDEIIKNDDSIVNI